LDGKALTSSQRSSQRESVPPCCSTAAPRTRGQPPAKARSNGMGAVVALARAAERLTLGTLRAVSRQQPPDQRPEGPMPAGPSTLGARYRSREAGIDHNGQLLT